MVRVTVARVVLIFLVKSEKQDYSLDNELNEDNPTRQFLPLEGSRSKVWEHFSFPACDLYEITLVSWGGADLGRVAQCLMGGTLSGNATQPADGMAISSLYVTGHK